MPDLYFIRSTPCPRSLSFSQHSTLQQDAALSIGGRTGETAMAEIWRALKRRWRVWVGGVVVFTVLQQLRNEGHRIANHPVAGQRQLRASASFADGMALLPLSHPTALLSTDTEGNQAAILDDLLRWMLLNGASLPLLNRTRVAPVRYGKISVRGVVATAHLPSDTMFASVPSRLLLSRESAMLTELAGPIARERLSAFISLVLTILVEGARARREPMSAWAPYMRLLDTVPTDMPSTWTASRLAEASEALRALAARHARTVAATLAALRRRAPDALALAGNVSLAEFSRAWDLAMSRFWLLSGRAIMVPFADLFNYGNHANNCDLVKPKAGVSGPAGGSPALDHFELWLRQPYRSGEEIQFFYNQHCSEEFNLYYGFTPFEGAKPCELKHALSNYWFNSMMRLDGSAVLTDSE